MAEQTDEILLKKASLPGRDILGLAMLATVSTVAVYLVAVAWKESWEGVGFLPWGLVLISASYWSLGVAARRGSRNAVSVLLVILTIMVALGFVETGFAKSQGRIPYDAPEGRLVIGILIIAFLVRDYKILAKLKKRGLWEAAFPARKPTKALCTVGGVLLAGGIVMFNVGLFQAITGGETNAEVVKQGVQKFVSIRNNEEAKFLAALNALSDPPNKDAYDDTVKKLTALLKGVETLREEMKGVEEMGLILQAYAAAVGYWKKGLELIPSDGVKALAQLEKGNEMLRRAVDEFNKRFAKKGPRGRR